MGTRFILGRAGSGKSHFLHEALVRHVQSDPLNASVLLIVPKQATFTYERTVATEPRLGGFINVHVISPDDLGELVLVDCGTPAGTRIDAVGRELILSHLLRTHADELVHFGRSARTPGLASQIDATFAEFERAGRDLCDIDDLIEQARSADGSGQQTLARKLTDLCTIYKLYQTYLTDHGFDAFARQGQAIEAVENCRLVQRSLVLIDDFYEFTAYERLLLAAVAKSAKQTLVAMLVNPSSPISTHPQQSISESDVLLKPHLTYQKLHREFTKAGASIEKPLLLNDQPRFAADELRAVEHHQIDAGSKRVTSAGATKRIIATDPVAEVDAAAREILSLVAQGYRLRDICLLARSIDTYESLIDASFAEHQIAYFTDKRRSASHHPLVRTLTSLAMLVQTRWSHESVIDMLGAGISGADAADVDLLDDYIRQHNLPPRAWMSDEPWDYHRPIDDDEATSHRSQFTDDEVDRVNALRARVRQCLATIGSTQWASESMPLKQRIADVFAVIESFDARRTVLKRIKDADDAGRIEERDEHLQVWTRITELADQMVDLLGDVPTTGLAFAQMLQQTLGELDLAITPATLDQVLVGSIERTRTHNPRAVIFLGMNAGQFPMTISEQPVLNDRDRLMLTDAGIEVRPASRAAILEERFLGYLALTRSAEQLTLIRSATDEKGNPLEPSPFWRAIDEAIVDSPVHTPPAAIEQISTPRQLLSHALVAARNAEIGQDAGSSDLYDWLVKSPTEAVKVMRDQVWRSLRYDNQATLTPALSKRLFTSTLISSVSRFESFASCPFQHFANYGLRLQPPPDPDVTAMDTGLLYHSVLERLIRQVIESKIDFSHCDPLTPKQIRAIATEVAEQLRNQIFLSNARSRYTLERLESVVQKLVAAQQFVAGCGSFAPAYVELVFGKDQTLPPLELTTPSGNTVVLRGRIDRLDLDKTGQYYTVIDYKSSAKAMSMEAVAHGLALQLLTYLLVIDAHGPRLFGKPTKAAAALYVQISRKIESTTTPDTDPEPGTPDFHARHKPRGLINEHAAGLLDKSFVSTGRSEAFAIKRNKDGTLAKSGCDAVPFVDFERLAIYAHETIIRLADEIIEGQIRVHPYLLRNKSPCPMCQFKRVCRFDRLINQYHVLKPLKAEEALAKIRGQDEAEGQQ
jgi:ATP-dependent helicase/nuclease subunit B